LHPDERGVAAGQFLTRPNRISLGPTPEID
jgi:hypothetical protein